MKRIFLCLWLLSTAFTEARAMPSKSSALPPGSVLEADFTQYRHLNGIHKPIKSEGHMILWDGKGLAWTTISPFPNAILITTKGLYQLQNRVKTPMVKGGGDRAMFDVMAGIFNVTDAQQIKGFVIQHLPPGNYQWRLRLHPQHEQVRNLISSITLEGDLQIRHITIYRSNGDHDEIDIKNHAIKESVSLEMKEIFDE